MLHVKHLLGPSSIDLLNDVIQKMKLISIRIDNDPENHQISLYIHLACYSQESKSTPKTTTTIIGQLK